MPIYEYECEKCQKRYEVLQRLSDPPMETCSNCSGKVHKMVSASGLVFKGSGWYITDYAKKNGSSSDSKGDPKGSSGDGKPASNTPESPKKEAPSSSNPSSKES